MIVPLYNVEKYLTRCVDSVLSQGFNSFELILIDDGSTDLCSEICERYLDCAIEIIIIHQKNQGQASARNIGLDYVEKYSKSGWITFVDSDDWISKEYLELLFKSAKKNNTSISICNYNEEFERNENAINKAIKDKLMKTEDLYCDYSTLSVVPWGKLYNRRCFQGIRYPVGKICEDEFVTYKVLFQYSYIPFVVDSLYYYFQNKDGVSKTAWTPRRMDSLEALRNQVDYFKKNNLEKAYKRSIINAAINISNNYNQIIDSNKLIYKEKYIEKLRIELRKILRYKNAKRIIPFNEYIYLYDIAYPCLMNQYWRIQTVKSKIKRKKH